MNKFFAVISSAVTAILAAAPKLGQLVPVAPVETVEAEAKALVARIEAEAAAGFAKAATIKDAAYELLMHSATHNYAAHDKKALANRIKRVL